MPGLTPEQMQEALGAYRLHGGVSQAARALEMPRKTLAGRLEAARRAGMDPDQPSIPDFPDDDIPADEIIQSMCDRYTQRKAHHDAQQWFPIHLKTSEPIALASVGDMHVDDDGCNWPLLERDLGILADTPGMHAIHVGDAHNNWVGRLQALYAHQETSKKTAYKLIKHVLKDRGVPWLLWLLGNHDEWNDGGFIIKEIAGKELKVFDWQAKFRLVFKNGVECPVWASHNFKGTSIYNANHGSMKAAKFGQICPLILAQGHHHEYALHQGVYEDLDRVFHAFKCRGYKFIDKHADKFQFGSNSHGATVVNVIDPSKEPGSAQFIHTFPDLEQGADFLKFLRNA